MTNHWAIIVGINQYQSLQPLNFAQRDAQALQTCLVTEAGLMPERCILLTETSPPAWDHETYPDREHLNAWLDLLNQQLVQSEDWLWVFFNGYGVCWQGQDYLLPIDADPTALERTSITIRSVFERLKSLPTDRILLLLDINRSQAIISGERVGIQTAELAKEFGIATILASQPDQFSQEAPDLAQGLFTAALLESLRAQQASPLEKLEQYLSTRLPELSDHHYRPLQHPLVSLSSLEQLHQATLPPVDPDADWNGGAHYDLLEDAEDSAITNVDIAHPDDPWHLEEPEYAVTSVAAGSAAQLESPFANQPSSTLSSSSNQVGMGKGTDTTTDTESLDADDLPDPFFWQRFLWGIGLVTSVLLFGVLARNWSAIFGGQSTVEQSSSQSPAQLKASNNNPAASSAKSPGQAKPDATGLNAPPKVPPKAGGATSGNTPKSPAIASAKSPIKSSPVKEAAKSGSDRLAEARALIKPSLASEASRAIAIARKVAPNDPQYAQAQLDIDRWSQDILEIAKQRAVQKDYKRAIGAAQLVPDDRPQIYAEAQKAIGEWKKKR